MKPPLHFPARIEALESRIAPAFTPVLGLGALDGFNGFRANGIEGESSGASVAGAGDFNGDGFDDLLIGAPHLGDPLAAGSVYVLFGKAGGFDRRLDLAALDGASGIRIFSGVPGDFFGRSVSGAGDVNRDGVDDIVIGADGSGPGGAQSSTSYVIFGRAGAFDAELSVATLNGANGFRIDGESAFDAAGYSVSGAGDVNGDGFADVIVGAPNAGPGGLLSGAAYVLFGKAGAFAPAVSLAALDGANGFRLSGAAAGDRAGFSVSSAGDVNNDGFDDVIAGAFGASPNGALSGSAFVYFGKTNGFAAGANLASLDGTTGFRINGEAPGDAFGSSAAGAGDVNGDGFADVLIGAPNATSATGASYVVLGSRTGFAAAIEASALNGLNGFQITGAKAGDRAGTAVSGAGDVNKDGFADFLIGAPGSDAAGDNAGAAYLVFGRSVAASPELQLSSLNGSTGIAFPGRAAGDLAGTSVHAAGDINADGFADIILGAPGAGATGGFAGAAAVVFGFNERVSISADGRVATFNDADSDIVKVKLKSGRFLPGDLDVTGGGTKLAVLDLRQVFGFEPVEKARADVVIKVKQQGIGDGVVSVGTIDASGLNLGKVKVTGSVERIVAGAGADTTALQSLKVSGNFGGFAQQTSFLGGVKKIAIDGSIVSGTITATTGLKSLKVGGNLQSTMLLIGYDGAAQPVNPDAMAGKIEIGGSWIASSLAVGIADITGDGFGRNDAVIAGDITPDVFSRIAKIVIRGGTMGTSLATDHFGITAQRIGKLKIGGEKQPLSVSIEGVALDGDFRAVQFA